MFEFLFTSAPKTLDGSGYGAVGKSHGFPAQVEQFIRQHLNQFDFSVSAGQPGEPTPSAVFSYTRLKDAEQNWHILSRVASGGQDYTQREVFLAHHVVLSSEELANSSVPLLMSAAQLFICRWDGAVGILPNRSLPAALQLTSHLETWASLTSDAKWAQEWISRWLKHRPRPQFLVLSDNSQCLQLFAEAASLLNSNSSDRATFLTNLTSNREGLQFDWIGLMAESAIAKSVMARFPDQVLDLRRPLGPTPARQAIDGPSGPSMPLGTGPSNAPAKKPATRPNRAKLEPPSSQPAETKPAATDDWDRMIGAELLKAGGASQVPAPTQSKFRLPPVPPPKQRARFAVWQLVAFALTGFVLLGAIGESIYYIAFSPQSQPEEKLVVNPPKVDSERNNPHPAVIRDSAERVTTPPQLPRVVEHVVTAKGSAATAKAEHSEPIIKHIKRISVSELTRQGNSGKYTLLLLRDIRLAEPKEIKWFPLTDSKGLADRTRPKENGLSVRISDANIELEERDGECSLVLHYETMKSEQLDRSLKTLQNFGLQLDAQDGQTYNVYLTSDQPPMPIDGRFFRFMGMEGCSNELDTIDDEPVGNGRVVLQLDRLSLSFLGICALDLPLKRDGQGYSCVFNNSWLGSTTKVMIVVREDKRHPESWFCSVQVIETTCEAIANKDLVKQHRVPSDKQLKSSDLIAMVLGEINQHAAHLRSKLGQIVIAVRDDLLKTVFEHFGYLHGAITLEQEDLGQAKKEVIDWIRFGVKH